MIFHKEKTNCRVCSVSFGPSHLMNSIHCYSIFHRKFLIVGSKLIEQSKGDSIRHSGPSQNRGQALHLPTRKAVLINDYLLHIILKIIVCFLDQYSIMFLYPILITK